MAPTKKNVTVKSLIKKLQENTKVAQTVKALDAFSMTYEDLMELDAIHVLSECIKKNLKGLDCARKLKMKWQIIVGKKNAELKEKDTKCFNHMDDSVTKYSDLIEETGRKDSSEETEKKKTALEVAIEWDDNNYWQASARMYMLAAEDIQAMYDF
uniref:Ankyrin repeat protein n=1 Tax=Rhabditophanes sp. KR3021 TaxID=114890 RepID=A0AC35THS8_9BILA